MFHGFNVGRFDGHKHKYKVGAAYSRQIGVVLGGQIVNVIAHCLGVGVQGFRLTLVCVGGDRAIVIDQRDLAINNQTFAIGQFDHKIWKLAFALVVPICSLRFKVLAGL